MRTIRYLWLILLLWLGVSLYAFLSARHELLLVMGVYLAVLLVPFAVLRILDHKKK